MISEDLRTRNELRKRLYEIRRAITETRPDVVARLNMQLSRLLTMLNMTTVGVYIPFRAEPNVMGAIQRWLAGNPKCCAALPVVDETEAGMHYARYRPGDNLCKGRFGIEVPEVDQVINPQVIVSPCVGFTSKGYRLGNGGGYFDRYLKACQVKPQTVIVGYDALLCETFKPAQHDIPMDWIVTEARLDRTG